jgi:hypothetical protein
MPRAAVQIDYGPGRLRPYKVMNVCVASRPFVIRLWLRTAGGETEYDQDYSANEHTGHSDGHSLGGLSTGSSCGDSGLLEQLAGPD